jgi:hypothetical protein
MPFFQQSEAVIVNGGTYIDINNVVSDTSEYPPPDMARVDEDACMQREKGRYQTVA